METKKEKKKIDHVQMMKLIYLGVIFGCVILIGFMVSFTCFNYQKNLELKKEADAIVEKYKTETNEHNNKNDPDYAEIYFDDKVIYIPNEDVIIEYQP
jgi:hypothetical protein